MGIYKVINTVLGRIIVVAINNHLVGVYWFQQIINEDDFNKNTLNKKIGFKLSEKYKPKVNHLVIDLDSELTFTESPNDHLLLNTEKQLNEYFSGERQIFNLPISPYGTEFQMKTWNELKNIPFGETRSYLEQSKKLKKPKAFRAVGTANSKNPISIIIPCHRVIGNNGSLSGYAGGVDKKSALLELERKFLKGL